MNQIIETIEKEACKEEVTSFNVGDTIAVYQQIIEGNKKRVQKFQGLVLKKQNRLSRASVTVRKVVDGIGVEKTFLIHSPLVEKIEVISEGKVRKARLFYLRSRVGSKATKVKAKNSI